MLSAALDGAPSAATLTEVVSRIVGAVHPRRILVFGSAARGEMGPHSDLDLLVIMEDGVHRGNVQRQAYRSLAGLGLPKDVLVVTEADVDLYGGNPSLVLCAALREGREIYRVAS